MPGLQGVDAGRMREFCWSCHRPGAACFCELVVPFASPVRVALVVHPREAKSTVGTAWILRRTLSNLEWIRSDGEDLDRNARFRALLGAPDVSPLLLFPRPGASNLDRVPAEEWRALARPPRSPLFVAIDGTWTEAKSILRKSALLRGLPAVSFEPGRVSEYGFKKQPGPGCLSSVESVHQLMEVLGARGWMAPPPNREHDGMLEIFRRMVRFQLGQERRVRFVSREARRDIGGGNRRPDRSVETPRELPDD